MEFNFDRSVSIAHMTAAGWEMGEHNHATPFECHFFYLCDYRTNHTQMISIKQADFEKIAPPKQLSIEQMAGGIGELMMKISHGELNESESIKFGSVLVGYAKSTQTYRQWLRCVKPGERLHMLINIYPTQGNKQDSLVRPAVFRATSSLLHAEEVTEYSHYVRDLDKENHPEWFDARARAGSR